MKFKTLEYGMKGVAIAKAQKLLIKAGSKINPNGEYSIGMVSAVKAFQKRNGLAITGKIDKKTMEKLEAFGKPAKKK